MDGCTDAERAVHLAPLKAFDWASLRVVTMVSFEVGSTAE